MTLAETLFKSKVKRRRRPAGIPAYASDYPDPIDRLASAAEAGAHSATIPFGGSLMRRSILAGITVPLLIGVLACLLSVFSFVASCGNATEEAPDKTIEKLIADLGSDRFEVREAAMRTLKERLDAIPALCKQRQTADLEIRRRLDGIMLALDKKRATRSLAKSEALGKAGRAVEVADRLAFAATCGAGGEEGWDSLLQLADQVITRTEPCFPPGWGFHRNREFPAGDYRRYVEIVHPKEFANSRIEIDTGKALDDPEDVKAMAWRKFIMKNYGKLLFRGEEVSLMGIAPPAPLGGGMIASSGDVQITGASDSVVVSGGDITKLNFLRHCIVVCDGDVELLTGWDTRYVIIVARGKVTWKEGRPRNCLIRSGHTLRMPDGKTIDLKDGTPDPLAFVKFFELADVGLVGEDLPRREKSDAEGVRLREVRKDSPFATGLRSGDVVTAIEETKTPTMEIFRRVLRRKLAKGGPTITFTVRRSAKTFDVPIAVKD